MYSIIVQGVGEGPVLTCVEAIYEHEYVSDFRFYTVINGNGPPFDSI